MRCKLILVFFLYLFSILPIFGGTCPRGLSITEVLANENDEQVIFTCRVDSIYSTEEYAQSHYSFVTILQAFRGEATGRQVRISSGTTGTTAIGGRALVVGEEYLIFGVKTKIPNIYRAFGCDFLSINISKESRSGNLSWGNERLKMVQYFFRRQNEKYTGRVNFRDREDLYAVGHFKNGKASGEWIHYYGGEEEQVVCNYQKGKLHGKSKRYLLSSSDTILQLIKKYKHGKLVRADDYSYVRASISRLARSVKYNYKKNKTIEKMNYFSGKGELSGESKRVRLNTSHPNYRRDISFFHGKYNASQRNINPEKGLYKYGAKVGEWQMFKTNGDIDSTVIFSKIRHKRDSFRLYFPSGKVNLVGKIENGKKTGEWTKYSEESGLISRISLFENDILQGERQEFYWTENILRKSSPYRNGLLHGDVKTYRKNGTVIEINPYLNGLQHGERTMRHENDSLKFRQFYRNGMPIDTWAEYYENGTLRLEKSYKSGRLDGKYTTYDKSGKIKETGVYENGEVIGYWTYYEGNGKYKTCEVEPNTLLTAELMKFLGNKSCRFFTAEGVEVSQRDYYKN